MPYIYDAALYLRLSKNDMEEESAKSESQDAVGRKKRKTAETCAGTG